MIAPPPAAGLDVQQGQRVLASIERAVHRGAAPRVRPAADAPARPASMNTPLNTLNRIDGERVICGGMNTPPAPPDLAPLPRQLGLSLTVALPPCQVPPRAPVLVAPPCAPGGPGAHEPPPGCATPVPPPRARPEAPSARAPADLADLELVERPAVAPLGVDEDGLPIVTPEQAEGLRRLVLVRR